MRDAIIKKLNGHIAAGIKTEADVLYVMAELRKLIEQDVCRKKYPALSFYADWSLHSKIDRSIFADELLNRLDNALLRYEIDKNHDALYAVLVQEISFNRFHAELLQFCKERDIAVDLLLSNRQFGLLFLDVILDCPVLTKKGLKVLKAFSITRRFSVKGPDRQSAAFWSITTNPGQELFGPLF